MISKQLIEEKGFKPTNVGEYDCVIRLHEIHYLFYSDTLKHFAIGVKSDKPKGLAGGGFKEWNIIVLPKPIYNMEKALNLIEGISS